MEVKEIVANNYNVYIDEAGDEGFKLNAIKDVGVVNSLYCLQLL